MRKLTLLTLAAAACAAVFTSALGSVTSTISPGPWDLFKGSTKVSAGHPNLDACEGAARALNKAAGYTCRNSVKVSVVVAVDPPPAPIDHSHGPVIDESKIMAPVAGSRDLRIKATAELPTALNDFGAFRAECGVSHMAKDDPIVYPGQPGASHLHTFFGNTGANASSTAASLASSGNSTCRGGIANRTAYWVPTMCEITDPLKPCVPVKPRSAVFYYKTGYNGIKPAQINPLPDGLRMVAGDAANTGPNGRFRWKCIGDAEASKLVGQAIQNCPVGAELYMEVFFPQCWNGKDLDSPDHKSHMAYPVKGACPANWLAVPEITFEIRYTVAEPNQPLRWRLASDKYEPVIASGTTTAGRSAHGDWFDGWKPEIKRTWTARCDRASMDCHSHLLGDGREVY
ncbi:MAG TPA: DUF1996 domain-containing protein [Albitalea sp.]|jgi:hypothetical protein|nr:DUF1996 domain-containing protein [Albitalea sp.]